jgi:hypothetical protein
MLSRNLPKSIQHNRWFELRKRVAEGRWNPNYNVTGVLLNALVEKMNSDTWDNYGVYVWIQNAGPASFMPMQDTCASGFGSAWIQRAHNLYPGRDIPVGFVTFPAIAGSIVYGCSEFTPPTIAIAEISPSFLSLLSVVLAHEMTHILLHSTNEDEVNSFVCNSHPSAEMIARIQAGALQFEMPLPADYQFP